MNRPSSMINPVSLESYFKITEIYVALKVGESLSKVCLLVQLSVGEIT